MKLQANSQKAKVNPRKVLEEKRSLTDRVCSDLEEEGVRFFVPDDGLNIDADHLDLPENITDLPSVELGEYLNAFTQQKVYLRTLLGYAEVYAEEARREYVDECSDKYHDLLGTKLSETAKDREVQNDPTVRPLYEAWIDAKNKVKLLSYSIESIVDIIFMLSREVSRRTGDFNDERRDYNVHG